MKRTIAILAAALLIATACARGYAGQYEINIAIHTFGNEANEALTSARFKDLVEKRTNGAIAVNFYPNGTLGTELENIAQIKTGEIECALLSANAFQQIIPEYEATGIPFSFPSVASVNEYWSGEFGEVMQQELIKRNNMLLQGLLHRGARMLTASREIKTPADLSGLKLRVPEIKSWIQVWQAMGALPTPVNMNEVYTALQTKVVEGQENPIDTIYGAKINEVNNYIMQTEHLYSCFYWCFNKDFIDGLPEDLRKIVLDASKEALAWGNENITKSEKNFTDLMKKAGNIFVAVDKKAWMAAAKPGVIEASKSLHPEAAKILLQNLE